MITEADIKKMTKEERLEAVHMLWDSLLGNPDDEPASPDWHAEELAERTRRLDAGEETFLTIEEAKAQVAEFKARYRK
jgi:putative addiction module component (TIGR02574 family)